MLYEAAFRNTDLGTDMYSVPQEGDNSSSIDLMNTNINNNNNNMDQYQYSGEYGFNNSNNWTEPTNRPASSYNGESGNGSGMPALNFNVDSNAAAKAEPATTDDPCLLLSLASAVLESANFDFGSGGNTSTRATPASQFHLEVSSCAI